MMRDIKIDSSWINPLWHAINSGNTSFLALIGDYIEASAKVAEITEDIQRMESEYGKKKTPEASAMLKDAYARRKDTEEIATARRFMIDDYK